MLTQFEHYADNSAKESFADEQAKGSFAVSSARGKWPNGSFPRGTLTQRESILTLLY